MSHPDDTTLQRLFDGDLPAADRVATERHVSSCARCEGALRALESLSSAVSRYDDSLGDLSGGDAFADAVFAKLDAPSEKVVHISRAVERRSFPVRRVAFPAIAVAAAAVLALRFGTPVSETPGRIDPTGVTPITNNPTGPAANGTEPTPTVAGNTEVTRVDVRGAQSYAVLELPGVAPGATTAVVWIQDSDDETPSPQ